MLSRKASGFIALHIGISNSLSPVAVRYSLRVTMEMGIPVKANYKANPVDISDLHLDWNVFTSGTP